MLSIGEGKRFIGGGSVNELVDRETRPAQE
jgi:hypothetical protein